LEGVSVPGNRLRVLTLKQKVVPKPKSDPASRLAARPASLDFDFISEQVRAKICEADLPTVRPHVPQTQFCAKCGTRTKKAGYDPR